MATMGIIEQITIKFWNFTGLELDMFGLYLYSVIVRMSELDDTSAVVALNALAAALGSESAQVRIVLVGGVAGMLLGVLQPNRTTADCDVIEVTPEADWPRVQKAAHQVAKDLGLPKDWLNRDCGIFQYRLRLGWQSRLVKMEQFGSLEVFLLSRIDLFCHKICSAKKRAQDRDDLTAMRPTAEEIAIAEEHLNRLEQEFRDGEEFDWERQFLQTL